MWGETFDDFENEEQELAVAKQNLMSEPARADFTFSKLPLGIQPVDFMKTHFAETAGKSMQFRKGTTTLAFVYEPATPNDKGGIIVAVDSRASSGEYISSKSVMKILDIGDRMVATMAGGAADCQFWTRIVAKYCTLYELREKNSITVSAASKYFANVLYGYRGQGLSVGSMVAGYDKEGPQIFKVDSEGDRCQLKLCSVGSGSLNAYGILDNHYKSKMTDEEARKLGLGTVMHTNYGSSGSGGSCSTGQPSQVFLPNTQLDQMSAPTSTAPTSYKMKTAIEGFLWKTLLFPDTASLFVFTNEIVKLEFSVKRVTDWLPNGAQLSTEFSTVGAVGSTEVLFIRSSGKQFYFHAVILAPIKGEYVLKLKIGDVIVFTTPVTVLENLAFWCQVSLPINGQKILAVSGADASRYHYSHAGLFLRTEIGAPNGTFPEFLPAVESAHVLVPITSTSGFEKIRIYSLQSSKYYAGFVYIPHPQVDHLPNEPISLVPIMPTIEFNPPQ